MKRQYQTESELREAGFKVSDLSPKRFSKTEGDTEMIYQLVPSHYELIYPGKKRR